MKTLQKNLFALLLTLAAAPLMAQNNYTISSNRDREAAFKEYKTYAWAKQASSDRMLDYSGKDVGLKNQIKSAIKHEMTALGYEESTTNPDILINYRIFEEPIEVEGHENYFRDANYWSEGEIKAGTVGVLPLNEMGTPAGSLAGGANQTQKYYFDKGTILVQMVDAERGEVVWQGYASGIMKDGRFDKTQENVVKAISMIYGDYNSMLSGL